MAPDNGTSSFERPFERAFESMTVSTVVPALNAEGYIARAMDSALSQGVANTEVIVVDDGSTDRTCSIVESYRSRGVRLVRHQVRAGAAAARNTGVAAARGEYVAFLDADDEWLPGKLARQLAVIRADAGMSFVSCRANLLDENGRDTGDIYRGAAPAEGPRAWRTLLAYPCVATPSVLARRAALQAVGGFNRWMHVAEDQDMWIRLALLGPVGHVPDSLVRVYSTPGSLSKARFRDQADYVLPMVFGYIERNRHQLTPDDIRAILGERYGKLGQTAYAGGEYGFGAATLLRAMALGHQPVRHLIHMIKASSLMRGVKRAAHFVTGGTAGMSTLKDRARAISYALGSLGLYHLLFNRGRLTVAMFHRVIPRESPEWAAADEEYTLDTALFDQCLAFFARHYTVVSLDQVEAARAGGPPLPAWPLLITFDDGWADTLIHAAPLLAKYNMPAACFVVSSVLDDPTARWWQDSYGVAWRTKRARMEGVDPAATPFLTGLAAMSDLAPDARSALLDQWLSGMPAHDDRQMLTAAEVPALPRNGIAVGAHGASHLPLTFSRDPVAELSSARTRLVEVLAGAQADVTTLSFPHGRFDDAIVTQARMCGYKLMFTSAGHLNELTGGRPGSDVIGRIEVTTRHVASDGHFRPDLLACQLFLRPAPRPSLAPAAAIAVPA